MKKNDFLKEKLLKPKKQTVDFLLNYSKSLCALKTRSKIQIVSQN